ncbi:MAG TPA: TIGR02679 family protein [Longimicrobiaceae bacterium]|nr:TIGR02679 family protein [Longimicrobiaceae bacterium]
MRSEDRRQDLADALNYPGLERILRELRAKFQKSRKSEVTGIVAIGTDEEAHALQGLVGPIGKRRLRARSRVRIPDLDRAFRENTGFRCTLREALEVHFGPFVSRGEEQAQRESAERATFTRLISVACDCAPEHLREQIFMWIDADRMNLHQRACSRGILSLEQDFRSVIRALARLPQRGEFVLLAILADEAAGHPHAFNLRTSAGSLLERVLARLHPEAARGEHRRARRRRMLLGAARIALDKVSSRVDTFGLLGNSPHFGEWAAAGMDHPLNLRTIERLGKQFRAYCNVVFVVENPQVYEALLDLIERAALPHPPTIVCTHGWFNVAGEVLLVALVESGARLFYSGDFDPAGLSIALDLRDRHPKQVDLWRLTPADYRIAVRDFGKKIGREISPRVRDALPELAEAMAANGRVASQEALVEQLFTDIAAFVRSRAPLPMGPSPSGPRHSSLRLPGEGSAGR